MFRKGLHGMEIGMVQKSGVVLAVTAVLVVGMVGLGLAWSDASGGSYGTDTATAHGKSRAAVAGHGGSSLARAGEAGSGEEVALDNEPRIISPGTVSRWPAEFAFAVDPSAGDAYYTVSDGAFTRMTIMRVKRRGGDWSAPDVAPFSGLWHDGDPAIAPDGSVLLFISNRPRAGGTEARPDLDIWRIERRADGTWGEPTPLPPSVNTDAFEVLPTISALGNLYFSRSGTIYRFPLDRGAGQEPEALPFDGYRAGAVSPDEQLLVLVGPGSGPRDSDLFVSFNRDGEWSDPRRLAEPVNSRSVEHDPSFSPDGRTLYFASTRRGAPAEWPRPERVDVKSLSRELLSNPHNGFRNIYAVDVSELTPQSDAAGR